MLPQLAVVVLRWPSAITAAAWVATAALIKLQVRQEERGRAASSQESDALAEPYFTFSSTMVSVA